MIVLGLLMAPVFSLRLGMTDNGSMPESVTTRRAYDLLADGFGPGFNGPLLLSVELNGASVASLDALERAVAADPDVAAVAPVQAERGRHRSRAARHPALVAPGRGHHDA